MPQNVRPSKKVLQGRHRHRGQEHRERVHQILDLLRALKPGSKRAIIYQRGLGRRLKHTHGMSIYFPSSEINPKYRELDFYRDCKWGEFVEKFLASRRARGDAEHI